LRIKTYASNEIPSKLTRSSYVLKCSTRAIATRCSFVGWNRIHETVLLLQYSYSKYVLGTTFTELFLFPAAASSSPNISKSS
jgi:hypothetical protein